MVKSLFIYIFLLVACTNCAFAQLKKSKVIIYGDSEAAWAAAVQSARSGVHTLWIRQSNDIGTHFIGNKRVKISHPDGLDAGLWAEFLSKITGDQHATSARSTYAKQDINAQIARNAFGGISDSLKSLYQLVNVKITRIKKSNKNWHVELSSHETLKIDAIVDASDNQELLSLIEEKDLTPQSPSTKQAIPIENLYKTTQYRTGLFISGSESILQIPSQSVLNLIAENFFVLKQFPWYTRTDSLDAIPMMILSGQAIGASAAYCAFFKTNAAKINIRTLQGEIIAFQGQLIPFQDITLEDPNYAAIQRIGATGLLKGQFNDSTRTFTFQADQSISSKEIEKIMLELFTRSKIWFSDKTIQEMSIRDVLSLIKFTALKGDELDADVKKGWNQRFHFIGEYEPNACITRRQLAVLLDHYLKPFHVKIDQEGQFFY